MYRHTPHSSDAETDYSHERRMSSSAASDCSLHSRPEKRSFDYSPSASPVPKKTRSELAAEPHSWSPQPTATTTTLATVDDDARSELSGNSPRVQLPSIASAFQDRHEFRRASLPSTLHDSTGSNRLRLPTPTSSLHRSSQSHSGLSSYQFPSPSDADHAHEDTRRPRLTADTQIPLYPGDYSVPSSAFSGSFSGNSPLSGATSVSDESWAPGIVRPASTPNRVHTAAGSPSLKYSDDRQGSAQALYGGVTRIAGQHHHASAPTDRPRPLVKTEGDWAAFGSSDYASMSSVNAPSGLVSAGAPAINVNGSPTRSPQQQHQQQAPPPSLVERPPRKRGKLPKPVTDYLKDWLHRHSDHPYPSEEEKKALCNATGLSMSQVSNWMINARRRILAPARVAAGPQTNLPYATPARPSLLDGGRRASMPADGLTLYHPMSLQSLPEYALGSSTRHMVGMTRSMSSSHASAGALGASSGGAQHHHHHHHPYALDASYTRLPYGAGGALHPSAHVGGTGTGGGGGGQQSYLGVPLSAPASMGGGSPFGSQSAMYQGSYSRVSSEGGNGGAAQGHQQQHHQQHQQQQQHHQQHHQQQHQQQYAFPDHGHSVSPQPGSGYTTPH
ncbi:uncharacterized protein PHACADRAFT_188701 [Phanerochaete carnosa HHB-10118-sp]|uniref:Homeobox domain-containing protein n=1 Tax=Phanerochaete carnosa (strain HHB-10118-sp) TaxID=650164 RepID=K5UJ86_PHACS|nr:uncharacterized protein PHACADRAFT_188701 [Phanerochaete carnosa HHB-10118-sp]EKM49631.1 hypothetical protein PHACADRAFT_188701 [Phanerochaete carnosa HHB-10118-sp]